MNQEPFSVEKYRAQIEKQNPLKFYHGAIHFLFTVSLSFFVMGLAFFYLQPPKLTDLLAIPVALLLANLVEYLGHRFLLHKKHLLTWLAYREHTLKHHSFFTHDHIAIRDHRDMRRVLFPWLGIAFFVGALGMPIAYGVSLGFSKNIGLIFFITEVFYFFTYETCHLICHFEDSHPLFKIPLLKNMKEHHRLHHHQELMGLKNFGIVGPLFDYIFHSKIS